MKKGKISTDILIVGGGPAGASAALSFLTYTNFTVTLIEPSGLDGVRVGEHVDGSLFAALAYLDISKETFEAGTFIKGYSKVTAWGSELSRARESLYDPAGESYQLDREKFDATLLREVSRRGGRIFPRTRCVDYQQLENGEWRIGARHLVKKDFFISARFLVDATGRQGQVCRQLGIRSERRDTLVGVGAFFQLENNNTGKQDSILESGEKGWWYSAALPGGMRSVTFFSDADIIRQHRFQQAEQWAALLQTTRYIKEEMRMARSYDTLWTRNAFSQLSDTSLRSHFIAAGDAASSFDPISSMGIGFALNSGCNAARAANYFLQGDPRLLDSYQQELKKNFETYWQLRAHFYGKETRWQQAPFWERRLLPGPGS